MADELDKRTGMWALGERIVTALPAPFLALALVNVCFVVGLLWFLDARATHTAELVDHLLSACVGKLVQH